MAWAMAVTIIVVIAFAIGLIILFAVSVGNRRKAELRAIEAEHTIKDQALLIKKLEGLLERESRAREALRAKFDKVRSMVLTIRNNKALPVLLTDFFKNDSEGL